MDEVDKIDNIDVMDVRYPIDSQEGSRIQPCWFHPRESSGLCIVCFLPYFARFAVFVVMFTFSARMPLVIPVALPAPSRWNRTIVKSRFGKVP
jgi:hypothetical protein